MKLDVTLPESLPALSQPGFDQIRHTVAQSQSGVPQRMTIPFIEGLNLNS